MRPRTLTSVVGVIFAHQRGTCHSNDSRSVHSAHWMAQHFCAASPAVNPIGISSDASYSLSVTRRGEDCAPVL
jgi:hypothetical protein